MEPLNSTQMCILKWLVKDVVQNPTIKTSPLFEIKIGQETDDVTLSLNTNHNMVQISIKPEKHSEIKVWSELITNAVIIFRYSKNQTKINKDIQFQATADCIIFDQIPLSFNVITNDYTDPFEVEVHLNLQPTAAKLESRSPSIPTTSEPENKLVQTIWKITDFNELPLIKESPVFSLNFGNTTHLVQLTMDINNDRIQIRLNPMETNTMEFAKLIEKVSVVCVPENSKIPSIKSENVEVRSVFPNIIYLSTIKVSFAALTTNYTKPFSVTMKISLNNAANRKNIDLSAKQASLVISPTKPFHTFNWHMLNLNTSVFPLTKTSPLFQMQLHNKSTITVQLLLMHHRTNPIRLFMTTPFNQDLPALATSIGMVTIKITYANGLARTFKDIIAPKIIKDLISFELLGNDLSFADLTNNFKDSFRMVFSFYRPPPLSDADVLDDQKIVPPPIRTTENLDTTVQEATPCLTPILPPTSALCLFAPNPQPTVLLRQFNTMLVDQVDCDIYFVCQGVSMGAHRIILQTRSAFFKELLQQHIDQSVFHLKSVDAETMTDTLQFIYTGTAPRISSTADRLLSVANFMELPDLYELAQTHLLQKRPSNSMPSSDESISKLLYMFEHRRMQPAVGMFIESNLDELLANSRFEHELRQRPELCYDVLTSMHAIRKAKVNSQTK